MSAEDNVYVIPEANESDSDQDWSDNDHDEFDDVAVPINLAQTSAALSHELEFRASASGPHNHLSNVLAGSAATLEHQLKADRLSHALHEPRTSGLQMSHAGEGVSPVLLATSHQLEKQMTADALSRNLAERKPSFRRTSDLSQVLAAPAHELERNLKISAVSHQLGRRSSQQELVERGVLLAKPSNMSDILVAPAKELEKNMRMDSLHAGLSVAQRTHQYLQVANGNKPEQTDSTAEPPQLTVKERMEKYKNATMEAAKKDYSATSPSKAEAVAAAAGTGQKSLMERLMAYTQTATTTPTVKRQVDDVTSDMRGSGKEEKEVDA